MTKTTFTTDPKGVKKLEFAPVDDQGNFSGVGSGFVVANAKFAINGYIYGTGPTITMKKGDASAGIWSHLGTVQRSYPSLARQRRVA